MNCEILCLRIWSDKPVIANEILSYSIYFHCLIKSPSYLQKAADLRLFSVKQHILRFEATTSHLKCCQFCLEQIEEIKFQFQPKNRQTEFEFTLNSLLSQFCNQEKLQKHTSITLRWCIWTNLLTCIPVHAHETGVLAVPPIAWLTGPSKNGADINRLGRSHVSVYTGRPRSSTTRALDSLCTANLHTIHLCLIQKHFIRTQHTRGMGMHIQHICASMQKCSHSHLRHVKIQMLQAHMAWLFLSPTQYCGCLISFPLHLSFRAFSSCFYLCHF